MSTGEDSSTRGSGSYAAQNGLSRANQVPKKLLKLDFFRLVALFKILFSMFLIRKKERNKKLKVLFLIIIRIMDY